MRVEEIGGTPHMIGLGYKFHKDWLYYDYQDLIVNKYPLGDTPVSLIDALKKQAKTIHEEIENPIVFMSGGIDSQAVALAFKGLKNVRYVFICPTFEGRKCETEYFFATQFAQKHDIPLEIVEEEYDRDSLKAFLEEKNFWNTGTGAGTIFQLPVIERERKNGYPITADGHFVYERRGERCYGTFKKPGLVLSQGIKLENQILFDFYAPYMFMYYEQAHIENPELQYHKKIEAKNLIYNELGFPFRPKLSGWEFLIDMEHLPVVDWSNDHSYLTRSGMRGPEVIAKLLDIPKEVVQNKLSIQFSSDSSRYITLYEFPKSF